MRLKHPKHYPNKPKYYPHKIWAWINIRLPRLYYSIKWNKNSILGLSKIEAYDEKLNILLQDNNIYPSDIVISKFISSELSLSKLEEFGGW